MHFLSKIPLLAQSARGLATQSAHLCFVSELGSGLESSNATIHNAHFRAAGSYNITNTADVSLTNQYDFCDVDGSISYGSNSTLNFNIWLPDARHYNGRFMAVGNGGMAGTVDESNLLLQMNAGFAVAGGDAGHLAVVNNNGAGAPETFIPYLHDVDEVEAWIHNAIALFVPTAKKTIATYYGKEAQHNYYNGCSTGGAQGFALAQFHPEMFNGIIAGSPGNWYSHLALSFLWNHQSTEGANISLPQSTLNLIKRAVVDACDKLDGVNDGLIENPLACPFDIHELSCSNFSQPYWEGNDTNCLTDRQIAAAKSIYAGPKNNETGGVVYPGFSLGSESEWLPQEGALANSFSIPTLQNLVYKDLNYSSQTFNWASDIHDVDDKAGKLIDEIDLNLTAFRNNGGKLLVTQGWSDPYDAATWPIEHMRDIQHFFGDDISDFFNLFMIPGGGHCGSAASYPHVPSKHHTVPKMVQWVERGEIPDAIHSTDPADGSTRTRKLCPWPRTATYVFGDVNEWTSYACRG